MDQSLANSIVTVLMTVVTVTGVSAHVAALVPPKYMGILGLLVNALAGNYGHATNKES